MKSFRLLVLLLPLLLTACGLSEQQKADYAAVQRAHVDPAIYDKMVQGDALSLSDIEALSRARVSDAVTLRYLRNTQTIYTLNANDVQNLVRAGVSKSVIDYMMQTPQLFQPVIYPVAVGVSYGPYWGPGPYSGPGPYYYRRGCGPYWH